MERLSHIYDCLSNLIFFDKYIQEECRKPVKISNEQYAKALKTIAAPALIIELNNDCQTRYYYRGLCWDKTLLIGVSFINGIWKANEYLGNPSGAFLLGLLNKNLLKGSTTLYLQNEIVDNGLENPLK